MTKIIIFTLASLILPVLYWLLILLINEGYIPIDPKSGLLGFIRGYTPTIAAILTIYITSKSSGLKEYWNHIWRFRAPLRSYLIVVLAPFLLNLVVFAVSAIFNYENLEFESLNPLRFLAIYIIFIFLDGPLGEELGWRGYFLPELLRQYNPLTSSLVIGVVWFLWHVPLYAADGKELSVLFLSQYLIAIAGHAIFFTYVYLKISDKTIFAVLLHTSINYFIFFRNSLVPSIADTPIDNTVYMAIVVMVAFTLAIFLRKESNVPTKMGEISK